MRGLVFLGAPCLALAAETASLDASPTTSAAVEEIVVVGRAEQLIGVAGNASDGTVGPAELRKRAYSRPAEVLETVPGLIVTQHSGSGKANQYFLRGFNLDHGTDFSVSVDGVPVNLPTHAHGQGYLDLNWVPPELIDRIDYRKGPYHSEVGDFSSAGSASMHLVSSLSAPIFQFTVGEHQYGRLLAANSAKVLGDLKLVWAVDATVYDGPWLNPENAQRATGLVKLAGGDQQRGWDVTGVVYGARWDSTDQAPQRTIGAGLLSPLDSIDHSDGGVTGRNVLSGRAWRDRGGHRTEADLSWQRYRLDLFSNFTFFLNDPVNGDQFAQVDRRDVYAGSLADRWSSKLLGHSAEHEAGLSFRRDDIDRVELDHTAARNLLGVTRRDGVVESNEAAYYQHELHWSDRFRTFAGLRANRFQFDVDAQSLAANSGRQDVGIVTEHLGAAYQLSRQAELYVHAGSGFHSNDARGVTIRVDPSTGVAASQVPALVRSDGREIGIRIEPVKDYQLTLTGWELELGSELVFSGDAGTTEASRASARRGIELANYYKPRPDVTVYADVSLSRARFTDPDPVGLEIPGSIERVIAAGVNVDRRTVFGALNVRHFGPRPLIEDNSVRSGSTTIVNAQLGHRGRAGIWTLDILNLLDSREDDISYFYTSRLPGEPAEGVADVHSHPVVPREARLTFRMRL